MTVTLEQSYAHCRTLNKRYGTTYYLSTYALPRVKRHHVWALYAFCRHADDIVDEFNDAQPAERSAALHAFGERFFADLDRYSDADLAIAFRTYNALKTKVHVDGVVEPDEVAPRGVLHTLKNLFAFPFSMMD